MNTARLLVPIFTLQDFLYLLLDFLLAGFHLSQKMGWSVSYFRGISCLPDRNIFAA